MERSLQELIQRARAGDERALGQLCEQHRPYLRLLAQRTLDSQIGVRADASDVVQRTLLSAIRNFKEFQGDHSAQFVAWLQVIHGRNVVDTIRAHTADKRAVNREGPVAEDRDRIASQRDSPSARAMRSEEAVQLKIEPKRGYRLGFLVEPLDDQVRVRIDVDSQRTIEWSGPIAALSPDNSWSGFARDGEENSLGLFAHPGGARLDSLRLRGDWRRMGQPVRR